MELSQAFFLILGWARGWGASLGFPAHRKIHKSLRIPRIVARSQDIPIGSPIASCCPPNALENESASEPTSELPAPVVADYKAEAVSATAPRRPGISRPMILIGYFFLPLSDRFLAFLPFFVRVFSLDC